MIFPLRQWCTRNGASALQWPIEVVGMHWDVTDFALVVLRWGEVVGLTAASAEKPPGITDPLITGP